MQTNRQCLTNIDSMNFVHMHLNLSQSDCLKNIDGEILFDFLGRTETLMDDLKYVLFVILKLEKYNFRDLKLNKTHVHIKNIEMEYIIQHVNNRLNEDFVNFDFQRKL